MSPIRCAIVLACELIVFYWKILAHPSEFIIPWDFRYFHLPMAAFIADSLHKGYLPLWDPYTYSGLPFYATLTPQLFYPPMLLTALVSNLFGGQHLAYFLEIQALLHIFLGGLGMCALLRRLGATGWAPLIGATIFQLGPYFTSQLQHLGAVDAAAWMPIACYFVVDLMLSPSRRSAAGLAFSLAMSLLCGFPSTTCAVVIACLLVAVLVPAIRQDARSALRSRMVWVAAAFVLAVGLAAVELIPSARLSAVSVSRFRGDWMGEGGMPLEALISLLVPDYHHVFELSQYTLRWNPTFVYLYCGIPALILIPFAFFRKTRVWAGIFGLLTLAFLVVILGSNTGLGKALMPVLLRATRYSVYVEFLMAGFVLGAAVLAGLGASRVLVRPWQGALLTAVVALDLIHAGSGRVLNTASIRGEPGVSYDQFEGNAELLTRIRAELGPGVPGFRMDTMNDSSAWATTGTLTQIATSNGNDPFALSAYLRVRSLFCKGVTRWGRYYQVSDPDSRWLDFLSVRLLLSRTPVDAGGRWEKLADFPQSNAYLNRQALPRFFFVSDVVTVKTPDEAFQRMQKPEFEPRITAVLQADASLPLSKGCELGRVTVKRYEPNVVELEAQSPGDCLVVSSEVFYPGWRVTVDGDDGQVRPVNLCFRGTVVPKGSHRIAMTFRPWDLYLSSGISLLSVALLGLITFRR